MKKQTFWESCQLITASIKNIFAIILALYGFYNWCLPNIVEGLDEWLQDSTFMSLSVWIKVLVKIWLFKD